MEVDDWDISTANYAEVFCGNVTETANTLYYNDSSGGGGVISLDVELWDMNSIGWSDSLFADAYHFNAEGTKRFSSQIAERLRWSDR